MDKCWLPSVTFWPLGSLLVVVKSNTAGSGLPNLLYVFLCTFGPLRGPTEPRVGHKRLNAQCCSTVAVESVLCALCVVTQGEDMLHGWCICRCDHLHLLSCMRNETPLLGQYVTMCSTPIFLFLPLSSYSSLCPHPPVPSPLLPPNQLHAVYQYCLYTYCTFIHVCIMHEVPR